jgi:hypothetical protein
MLSFIQALEQKLHDDELMLFQTTIAKYAQPTLFQIEFAFLSSSLSQPHQRSLAMFHTVKKRFFNAAS